VLKRLQNRLWKATTDWLNAESGEANSHLSNYERMRLEIRPADVVLVEGHTRVSNIIKNITLSSWTHAALYIGRLHDIEDYDLREYLAYHCSGDPAEPLVIEALLGEGTVVTPLSYYRNYHLRICRPKGLSRTDAELVIRHCIGCVGLDYDVRHLLDLARFLFPYGLLPRRWRSSLFAHNTGMPTRTVCSSMIGEAFQSVRFPVLPLAHEQADKRGSLRERNAKLFTPRDFDYSPYFEIIKYPLHDFDELAVYRQLPWALEESLERNPYEAGATINVSAEPVMDQSAAGGPMPRPGIPSGADRITG
jgi:hypothetical protein